MNKNPKISIITVSFNSAKTIKNTIESVLNQIYTNIEYIIIDGGSTDSTIKIVKSFGDKISFLISEKDNGIYDGMNKGIKASTGEYIGILNSDDFYPNNSVIQDVVNCLLENKTESLYGDLIYVDSEKTDKIIRYWNSGKFDLNKIRKGWMLPHPTFFVKKEIYTKFGLYSEKLKSAADYEMILRLLYKHKISVNYLPKIIVNMRDGGYSNRSIWSRLKGNNEDVMAWEMNGLKISKLLRFRKPFSKLKQFIKRPKRNE